MCNYKLTQNIKYKNRLTVIEWKLAKDLYPFKPRKHWSITVSFCQFSDWKLLISCIFGSYILVIIIIAETFNQSRVFSYCRKYMKLQVVSHWTGRNWQWLISVYAALDFAFVKFYLRALYCLWESYYLWGLLSLCNVTSVNAYSCEQLALNYYLVNYYHLSCFESFNENVI